MWIITTIGFFSAVQKRGTTCLTVLPLCGLRFG